MFYKEGALKILQNSQENTYVGVSNTGIFWWIFGDFQQNLLTEHLRGTALYLMILMWFTIITAIYYSEVFLKKFF